MKTLMILAILLSLFSAEAQVKTGGGGGPDIDTKDQKQEAYKEVERLKLVFAELSKELMRIEKTCTGRKSFPAKYNFIDSFYTLILKKQNDASPINEVDCKPTKKISTCLQSKELKKIVDEINQTKGGVLYPFLEKEYKIDKSDALVIIHFFIEK